MLVQLDSVLPNNWSINLIGLNFNIGFYLVNEVLKISLMPKNKCLGELSITMWRQWLVELLGWEISVFSYKIFLDISPCCGMLFYCLSQILEGRAQARSFMLLWGDIYALTPLDCFWKMCFDVYKCFMWSSMPR